MANKISDLVNPSILALNPYLPGKPIAELQRELGIQHIIKMASNENPLGPSPKAVAAMAQTLSETHIYPDSNSYDLKQALATHLGVESARIILGNGSEEILAIIARTFLWQNSEAIISQYGFVTFFIAAHHARGIPITVPAKNYAHDLDAMPNFITEKTKLIMLANPNNPTGTYFKKAEFIQFLQKLPAHIMVLLDEAYHEFVDDPEYPNGIELMNQFPNLIVTRTFSKLHGLAGIRVGYGVASAEVTGFLERARLPFNINLVAQAGATAALADREHQQKTLALNRQGYQQLTAELEKHGIPYIPCATNFITIDCQKPTADIYQKMLQAGVIVRPLTPWGMPHHLRVTIGTFEQNQRVIAALIQLL